MSLNIFKWPAINYSRKISPSVISYFLNGNAISVQTVVKNLGILSWCIWCSTDFKNIHTLKVLCVFLVKSVLEYCSLIWSPHYNDRIQSAQRKFYYKIRWRLTLKIAVNYDLSMVYLDLASLGVKRTYFAFCLM